MIAWPWIVECDGIAICATRGTIRCDTMDPSRCHGAMRYDAGTDSGDAMRYDMGPTRSHLHSLGPTRDYRSTWTHLGPNGVLDVGNSIDAMLRGAMRHGAMQRFVTSRSGDAMRYDAIVALRRCDAIRYDDVERCDTGRCDTD